MCQNCYDNYGKPKIINTNTIEAARLISSIYDFSLSGGYAHIVVDDWNLEDSHIDFCFRYMETVEDADEVLLGVTRRALRRLKDLSMDERVSALAIHEGFVSVEDLYNNVSERLDKLEQVKIQLKSKRDNFKRTASNEEGGVDILRQADFESLEDVIEEVLWI